VISEQRIGKDVKGSGRDLITVVSRKFPEGNEEKYEKPQPDKTLDRRGNKASASKGSILKFSALKYL
jgi:hypothetical protein